MSKQKLHANASEASKDDLSKHGSSIQVLNMSFPRTGTKSMQAALNRLGYKSWHSTDAFGDVLQCQRWIAAQDAKFESKGKPFTRTEWDQIFHPFTAISADPPAAAFADDLIAAYPEAKVILIERDEDSWYNSFDATVMTHMFRWDLHFFANLDPKLIGPVRDMQWHWVRVWWRVSNRKQMQSKAREMYREHNRKIRAVTPSHRLLEYRFKDGWGPLCEFLGKDVPDEPFPVMNDRAQVKVRNRWLVTHGLKILGRKMAMMLGAVFVVAVAWWFAKPALPGFASLR